MVLEASVDRGTVLYLQPDICCGRRNLQDPQPDPLPSSYDLAVYDAV